MLYYLIYGKRMTQIASCVNRWARRTLRLPQLAVSIGCVLPGLALGQDGTETPAPAAPVPSITAVGDLPRDLSPWGMFLHADPLVQAVLIGLVFASVVTWTVWLAKSIELLVSGRRARRALRRLGLVRSLGEAAQRLGDSDGTVGRFMDAAVEESRLSDDLTDREGIKERLASRLDRIEANRG